MNLPEIDFVVIYNYKNNTIQFNIVAGREIVHLFIYSIKMRKLYLFQMLKLSISLAFKKYVDPVTFHNCIYNIYRELARESEIHTLIKKFLELRQEILHILALSIVASVF